MAYQDLLLSSTKYADPPPPPHNPQRSPLPLQHAFSPLASLIRKTLNPCQSHILCEAKSQSRAQKDLLLLIMMDTKAEDHRWEYSQAWIDQTTEYQRQQKARQRQRHPRQYTRHGAAHHNKYRVHSPVTRYFLLLTNPSLRNLTLSVPELICVGLKHLLPVHDASPSPKIPSNTGQTSVAGSRIQILGMWSCHRYDFRTR